MGYEERAGAERRGWTGDRGSLSFIRLRDEVALIVLDGKLGDEAAGAWTDHFPWLVGDGRIAIFLDCASLTLPSASFVSTGANAIASVRSRLEHAEILVGAGLTEMLAKTANLTIGGMLEITRDRATFEASLERRLAQNSED